MSVKVMGAVWDLDLPSNEKFVLLAYADHADHEGESIYPAISLVARKTGYSERSIQVITRSLQKKGLLIPRGGQKGGRGISAHWAIPAKGEVFASFLQERVQSEDGKGRSLERERVNTSAPEPSVTIKEEPSLKAATPRANTIPEIVLYREVTRLYPPAEVFEIVVSSVKKVEARLGREVTKDDLLPFRQAWVQKGYNRFAVTWLEWAEAGTIPQNGNWKPKEPQGVSAARQWLEEKTHA